jgi:CspA family cold shock protein
MWRKPAAHGPVIGVVKFFKAEKGWGAISSAALPAGRDAWVHYSSIHGTGYRTLDTGDRVEFAYVQQAQDSFDYVAESVRRLVD